MPRKVPKPLSKSGRRSGRAGRNFGLPILDFGCRIRNPGSRFGFYPRVFLRQSEIQNLKSKMEKFLLMGDGLCRNASKFALKIAAKDRFREITYGDLNARVNQLAHALLSIGVGKGDGVALSVGNRIEHLEIVFATAKIGALAIPVDVKWKALELASVIAALEPKFIILQEDCIQVFDKAKELKDLTFVEAVWLSTDLTYG